MSVQLSISYEAGSKTTGFLVALMLVFFTLICPQSNGYFLKSAF
jgi:hypothetical protein